MSDEQLRADELVSAYLDGEATPAEIAEVEQDDALLTRVEQLRAVRDAAAAPVAPMPAELRDQMVETALAAADAGTAQRRETMIVPIHRRHRTLLAVAAAAVLLAAVVSAGLIAGRGGDDVETATEAPAETAAAAPAETATEAPAETATEAPAETAAAVEEESMAAPTTTAHFGMAEEPTAEAAPMPEAGATTAGAEAAMAEPEAAMEAPTDDAAAAGPAVSQDQLEADTTEAGTTEAGTTEAADAAESDDDPHRQVVDLGTFESLESLFDNIAARWSAAHQDGTMADSGTCSTAVHEEALELDAEAGQPFIATVGTEDPLRLDARFARRADGTAVIIYATPPSCETETHQQGQSDGS